MIVKIRRKPVNKRKGILFFSLIFVVAAIAFIVATYQMNERSSYSDKKAAYLSTGGYAAAMGIDDFTNEAFLLAYGEPEYTQRYQDPAYPERELVLHSYPLFDVLFLVTSGQDEIERLKFLQVVEHSEKFHFGMLKIGIGSSRLLVRLGYLFDEKLSKEDITYASHDFPEAEEGFYADLWWRVLFAYDSAGRVEKIAYVIAPN